MNKFIAIIAGEPNSISSEIIFKSWKLRNKFNHKPFFVIGSIKLLNLQKKKLNYKIKLKKIDSKIEMLVTAVVTIPIFFSKPAPIILLPLDRARGFGGNVIHHAVDATDFVDNSCADAGQEFVVEVVVVCRHTVS